MKKQRIVFIIHKLDIGGAERIIVYLANHLNREHFEVHLVLVKATGAFLAQVQSDVTVHDLDRSSAKNALFVLLKKLYELQPDRVFSGIGYVNSLLSFFIPWMNLLMRYRTRWVARETNVVSIINKKEKFTFLIDWLYRHTYKNFDRVVCQSHYMRDDLVNNYALPQEKTVIISNPVDIQRVQRLSQEPLAYTFPEDKVHLLAVGALRQQKRFDVLLEVMSQLDHRYHLTLIGGGVEEEKLLALRHTLGLEDRVTFVGHQLNPYNFMHQADVIILTSDYEGFPNVLLEANCCGTPIIAFGCPGGTAEIVEEDLNGYLVPCQDKERLIEVIRNFDKNYFDAQRIQAYIDANYNLDDILSQYETLLR